MVRTRIVPLQRRQNGPSSRSQEIDAPPTILSLNSLSPEGLHVPEYREYRLAFGTRADVFDFENVQYYIVDKNYRWPRLTPNRQAHISTLRLGNLEDCCRLLP